MDPAVAIEQAARSGLVDVEEAAACGDSDIQRFYNNSVVLVTGGSGFMGKQLTEKLFRMAPTPQEHKQSWQKADVTSQLNDESVVISGMSGLYPQASNVKDFSNILYNKVNSVTSENGRWEWKHPEVSNYTGKLPEVDRFDAQFFKVHPRQASFMDPMSRKILEQSYQAIYDAGINPEHLIGKKVGVYIASATSEAETHMYCDITTKSGLGITGTSKTMYANRISYWLDAKGPSLNYDDASCSSTAALEAAYSALNSGICEAAIIGAVNLCLLPEAQLHYNRCIKMSSDGQTKSFDEQANGCTRSEAISVLFLQKKKNALRVYAELVHVKNQFVPTLNGHSSQVFGFVRNPDNTAIFLKTFYEEANISPLAVEYVEAFGLATADVDKAELQSIEKVFCENRTANPLLVGSVTSNIGFTDAASGVTAITKVLLGYHHGNIANTLHCKTPRRDIAAIREGRMSIVTENIPFNGNYTAVNGQSIGGVNSHVLLHGHVKTKDLNRYKTYLPRLVTLSTRQEEHLEYVFEDMISRSIDPEEHALLHNIHSSNVPGHLGRGYIILDTDENKNTQCLSKKTKHSDEVHRPLWFVYSGMGSQWAGMGTQLMRIPVFAAAIERCQRVLEPKGIDILHIITTPDKAIFDNVLNCFVGIAAIQIGLTDVLRELGLNPDNIIGHSVGELGCAYADGCLTAEEMILSAYSRGKASNTVHVIRGSMAAVGLGYQQLSKICPPEIDIACHNSSGSSTISGPADKVKEFVKNLSENKIFAREVPSANIAYHSRYIADAGPELLRILKEIIKDSKPRSEKWLSTSVPQERWNEPMAKYCSPEYLTNNLLSSVLFEETCRHIPSNAVLIEIAPHGLLQAILKRSLPDTCINLPLTLRGHRDNALFLLQAIGNLYISGYTPKVHALYPKVQFPVSTGTPHLSHLVKWNHTERWCIKSNDIINVFATAASFKNLVSTYDDEHSYINGNVIQGEVVYPFAGALVAVWDTLAMTLGVPKKQLSVRFQDVFLYSQPILRDQRQLKLIVYLHRGNGSFEVLGNGFKVASGNITENEELHQTYSEVSDLDISSDELYQQFDSRGFSYRDDFRSIHSANETLTKAQLIWNGNWVVLIDGMLQLNVLKIPYEGVSHPYQIRGISIDVKTHQDLGNENLLNVEIDEVIDHTRCGGIILHNIKFRNMPTKISEFKLFAPSLSDINNADDKTTDVFYTDLVKSEQNNLVREHVVLQIASVGDLDTLRWIETSKFPERGVKVKVEYAGLNKSDVKRAAGIIPLDRKYYGMDFSGVTESGNRVMGLVRNGAVSTEVSALLDLLWPVPEHWSSEDAATVPLAYAQAFYYLCIRNHLKSGSRVLIHGGAGALGQAAISIALAHGCEVFTTVADQSKKTFLRKLFPQIKAEAIGNSRDASFGDMVMNATNGDGCKIVLCCTQKDLKNVSLKCSGNFGVTVDTEQILRRDKFLYGMFCLSKERSYMTVDFDSIFDKDGGTEIRRELQMLMADGITRGYVRPLSRVTFAPQEAPRAFRLLAASSHRGRVLLRLRDSLSLAQPRMVCSADSSYLIFWDGSLLGLQFADKLIACGAKKLRIHCLSTSTAHHRLKLRLWQTMCIDVKFISSSLTDCASISALLKETTQLGPIEGIFVLATLKGNKNTEELSTILTSLDVATRNTPSPRLKYFTVVTVDNNVGHQTCLSRTKDGFPATVLSLPALKKAKGNKCMDQYSWNRSAVEATERAISCAHPIVIADVDSQSIQSLPLMQQITALVGHRFENDDEENLTLYDMGLGTHSVSVIQLHLRDVCHISLEEEDILLLTKKKILQIQENISEKHFPEINGLDTFYSHVEQDELHATTDLVPLNTLVSNVEALEHWYDDSKSHLFIIPGVEGNHARFHTLCERLKLPAFVLQPGFDNSYETSHEMALRYSKTLIDTLRLKTNFYLLGYECGIFVTLELAAILEDHGFTGTVFCIGDGPEELKSKIEAELQSYSSEDALQTAVARHMFALMAGGDATQIDSALRGCTSWPQRLEVCVRTLLGRVSHSAQYVSTLIQTAYARITAARHYSSAPPRALSSRIVLLRARCDPGATSPASSSMQRFSQQPLVVHELAVPLAHATYDLRCAAIVNKHLDNDVLEAYENSNLCESYAFESLR